jgi:hypothetical protein
MERKTIKRIKEKRKKGIRRIIKNLEKFREI